MNQLYPWDERYSIFLSGSVPQFLVGTIKGHVYIFNNTFRKLEVSPWQLRVENIQLKGNSFLFLPRHGLDLTVRQRISLTENEFHKLGPEALVHIKPEGEVICASTWVYDWSSITLWFSGNIFNKYFHETCLVLYLYNLHCYLAKLSFICLFQLLL